MRRIAASVAALLGLGVAVVVLGPSAASAAGAAAGIYHPLAGPVRVLDTSRGTAGNHKGPLGRGALTRVSLGRRVEANASAALISLTTTGATSGGYLTAYRDGTRRPGVYSMAYPKGTPVTATVLVALSRARFLLYNGARSGHTQVTADLLGYVSGGSVSTGTAGAFTTVTPQRKLSSSSRLGPGRSVNVRVAPTGRKTTSALTLTVLGASRAGSLAVTPHGVAAPAFGSVYYPAGSGYSGFTLVRVDTDGMVTITNRGSRTVGLAVDTTGFFDRTSPNLPGALQALEPQRIVSGSVLKAGRIGSYVVAGQAGVARAATGAVAVAVTVSRPARAGAISVAAPGYTSTGTRTVSFAAGQTVGATTVVRTIGGRIAVRNVSGGSLAVSLDVLGYFPAGAATPPGATISRYLDDLTTSSNATTLRGLGCGDARTGTDLALLDVGAQSYHAPLGSATPGVAVALTSPTVRLTYDQLVTDIGGYLDGFAACAARTGARIAIGTSNSGNFSDTSDPTNPPYPASSRGSDWYTDVVRPLQAHAGTALSVVGANDIENSDDFDPDVRNALGWEAAYLAAAGPSGTLIYNGSATGCPTSYGSSSGCDDGWSLAQFVQLTTTSGTNRIQVLPQIYSSFNAIQWADIDRVAGGRLVFAGSLTEHAIDPTTFTAAQGWTALYRALSSVVSNPSLPRAVDITRSG